MSKIKKSERKRVQSPTMRARRTAKLLSENKGLSVGAAMIQAGYSAITAANPQQLTRSKQWPDLMDEYLPEEGIAKAHASLLNSHSVEHLTFPNESEKFALSDAQIAADLAAVNCQMRRIVHGEHARHVYFWSPDNRARKDALDMAYKLRGSYAAEKHLHGHVDFSLVALGKERDRLDAPEARAIDDAPDFIEP